MIVVEATQKHLESLEYRPTKSLRGWSVLDGDRVVGFAGVYISNGNRVLVSNITDELRRHPVALYRIARKLVGEIGHVYAFCDMEIEAAPRFLRHLGFEPVKGTLWEKRQQA